MADIQTPQAPPAPDEPERGDWTDRAKDEHAANFDPKDLIPDWEVEWMARELGSTDMTSDEFLRRTK